LKYSAEDFIRDLKFEVKSMQICSCYEEEIAHNFVLAIVLFYGTAYEMVDICTSFLG